MNIEPYQPLKVPRAEFPPFYQAEVQHSTGPKTKGESSVVVITEQCDQEEKNKDKLEKKDQQEEQNQLKDREMEEEEALEPNTEQTAPVIGLTHNTRDETEQVDIAPEASTLQTDNDVDADLEDIEDIKQEQDLILSQLDMDDSMDDVGEEDPEAEQQMSQILIRELGSDFKNK